MPEYMIREDKDINLIRIVKKTDNAYAYWNNRLKKWLENDWDAYDVFNGWADELYLPTTEEEVKEIVARYPKEA